MAGTQLIEQGDIFFFYRPRVEETHTEGREDVQRFYMVLAPKKPEKLYRLFLIGRKKLPQIDGGGQRPERRNWGLNVLTTKQPEELHDELSAMTYETKTRGERFVPSAKPVGEGRYQLIRHDNHTELAYVLELPEKPGPAEEAFEVREEASYIVSVKNPDVRAKGLPQPEEPPKYTRKLREAFGDRRWIDVDDPALLDYENAQVLMLGAHAGDVEEELGIEIDEEHERLSSAEVCRELRVSCEKAPVRPLLEGEFPETETAEREQARQERPWRTKAGERGGAAAREKAPSVSALTHMLKGIDLPQSRDGVVRYASRHKDRVENPDAALEALRELPDRQYRTMAEVTKALGEMR